MSAASIQTNGNLVSFYLAHTGTRDAEVILRRVAGYTGEDIETSVTPTSRKERLFVT